MKKGIVLLTAACAMFIGPSATAQDKPAAADNTKVNKRDRAKGAVTADQQKEARGDREVAADIRKAIVGDKDLSTYAHNIKVVVRNGAVTLKGPVRSEEEKKAIEAKATEVAGAGKVTNQISVKPKKS